MPGHAHLSEDALETSKLLVEVLQVGYPANRVGKRPAGKPRPPSPHVIRAAIHITQHESVTIGELADGLGISQGWASRLVDDMERAGQLERERDPKDRRVSRVRLSPMAMDAVEHAYRWRGDAVEAALSDLTDAQRAGVRTFLRRFVDGVRQRS